jgi:DNA-binding FrmR family transcriptional regulator
MDVKKKNKEAINRMNYLLGHLRGNISMLEENRYCIDVIKQNQAVIAALKKVNELLLQKHLDTCVVDAIESKSMLKRKTVLNELAQVFKEKGNGK